MLKNQFKTSIYDTIFVLQNHRGMAMVKLKSVQLSKLLSERV